MGIKGKIILISILSVVTACLFAVPQEKLDELKELIREDFNVTFDFRTLSDDNKIKYNLLSGTGELEEYIEKFTGKEIDIKGKLSIKLKYIRKGRIVEEICHSFTGLDRRSFKVMEFDGGGAAVFTVNAVTKNVILSVIMVIDKNKQEISQAVIPELRTRNQPKNIINEGVWTYNVIGLSEDTNTIFFDKRDTVKGIDAVGYVLRRGCAEVIFRNEDIFGFLDGKKALCKALDMCPITFNDFGGWNNYRFTLYDKSPSEWNIYFFASYVDSSFHVDILKIDGKAKYIGHFGQSEMIEAEGHEHMIKEMYKKAIMAHDENKYGTLIGKTFRVEQKTDGDFVVTAAEMGQGKQGKYEVLFSKDGEPKKIIK